MKSLLALFVFVAMPVFAVEAHYKLGVELKPLPILMTSMSGGQGVGVGFELNSSAYKNWVISTNAEVYRGPRHDEGMVPESMEDNKPTVEETNYEYQQIAFGLRSYSNRQDDSYYLGGEIAVANEDQEFEYDGEAYNIKSQSLRPGLEFGYRWIWQNGSMFRFGMKGVFISSTKNRLEDNQNTLPTEWRDRLYQSLDEAENRSDFYATMDLGIGYTF